MAERTLPPWLRHLTLASLTQTGREAQMIDTLAHNFTYKVPPTLDAREVLRATLVGGKSITGSRPEKEHELTLRPRATGYPIDAEIRCSCSKDSYQRCEAGDALLADLAADEELRAGLAAGSDLAPQLAELPRIRRVARLELTTHFAQKCWAPRDVAPLAPSLIYEVAIYDTLSDHTGGHTASWGTHPLLELRPRLPGERAIIDKNQLEKIRLPTRDHKAMRRCQPIPSGKKGFYVLGDSAAVVIELLRGAQLHLADGRALRFARSPALLRVVRTRMPRHRVGERSTRAPHPHHGGYYPLDRKKTPQGLALEEVQALEARWFTRDGALDVPSAEAILFVGTCTWLWIPATATLYSVPEDIAPDAAFRMFATPSVEVGEGYAPRLFRSLRGGLSGTAIELPPLPELGLAEAERPVVKVRLAGEVLRVRLRVEAIYSSGVVDLIPGAASESFAATRDLATETAALARVAALGLPWSAAEGAFIADDDDAARLWSEGVSALRASGDPPLELMIPGALAGASRRRQLAPGVRVKLVGGWFDASLQVTAEDVPVDLARLRAALTEGRRWVALDDGSLAEITEELGELLSDSHELVDKAGQGRLAIHQVGRVERWLALAGERASIDEGVAKVRGRIRETEGTLAELPRGLAATLRPYQHAGFSWLRLLEDLGVGGCLADDMGLGKTLTTLTLLLSARQRRGAMPSLVVCPTSVLGNWEREARRFTPELRVRLLHGSGRDLSPALLGEYDLLVTSYGVLRRDAEALAEVPLRFAVLDEAQMIKNASAATTKAARGLRAEVRMALSGTPVENRLDELWSLMDFVNPGLLGSRSGFAKSFVGPVALDPRGPASRRLRALVRPFLLRRTKRAVLSELPPKEEFDITCVLPPAQRAVYDATAKLARESVSQREGGELALFTALLRLRQVACDPRLVRGGPQAPSAKREAFLKLVRELVAEGRRALVFSQFVELLSLWRADLDREGVAYEYLDGSTRDRDAVVARFQEGDSPLFLISLKAGGSGLNLAAADTVIHCDPWWNPAVEDQATDRAHRMGQTRRVTVFRLIARGTVEERIAELKARKRTIADAAIEESEGDALKGLSAEDLAALLGDASGEAGGEEDEEEGAEALPDVIPAPLSDAMVRASPESVAALREAMARWLAEGERKQKELARKVGIASTWVGSVLRGADPGLSADEVACALKELTEPSPPPKRAAGRRKRGAAE